MVGLTDVGKRYPHEISGGQQQRVALARALAPRPELLLLDEPFSNLDVDLRERLGAEVRELLKLQNTTALLVTHDQHEAFAMADDIGVMHGGRLQQWGDAPTLYHHPANRFVADFVGQGAFLPARSDAPDRLQTELGPCSASTMPGVAAYEVLLRPEDVLLDEGSGVQATILAGTFRGAGMLYTLEMASGCRVLCMAPGREDRKVGTHVGIRLRAGSFNAFPK
jgi:iron(III) transport system ATP-binding protein